MENITIERPSLKGKTPEEAVEILDRWTADVADKLNYLLPRLMEGKNGND